MLHLMESGFFGKQLLNEGNLSLSENLKVRIFQSFYNYYNQSKWILVDGIPGTNTANAMKETFKKDKVSKDDFEKDHLDSLNRVKKDDYLSDLKTLNDIHNLRVLQAILCLAGETDVIPDGVLGPKTKAAIKKKLNVENITEASDDTLKKLIDDASANVKATDMSFKAEGVEVVGGAAGTTADATSGATDANTSTTDGKPKEDSGTKSDQENLKKEFLKSLDNVKDIVKNYINKLGFFEVYESQQIKFYGYNYITGAENLVNTQAHNNLTAPTSEMFRRESKKLGFEKKGCWRYIPSTGKIYLFQCESVRKAQYAQYDIKGHDFFKDKSYMY
jgi:peptidoglycan hydrolase-like protein with peptidoglycan-binding domain